MSPKILYLGCDIEAEIVIKGFFDAEILSELPVDLDKIVDDIQSDISLILVGNNTKGIALTEIAQCLKLSYQDIPIILVTSKPIPFTKKDLLKNGLSETYFFPLEISLFKKRVVDNFSKKDFEKLKLTSVKVSDLIDISTLPFDTYLYLPANKRYVAFNISGEPISEAKKAKILQKEVSNLFIEEKDLPDFYKAYAESIKNIQLTSKLSETQKSQILREISRDLLADLFTDTTTGMNTSIKVNDSCKEIINSYLNDCTDLQRWYDKITATAGAETDFYSNSSNAMIASVLLGIGLNLEKKSIEALAIAALLRNIGHTSLPGYLMNSNPEEMSAEEFEIYSRYPVLTVDLLKLKKVVMPELAQKIILQHQEKFDGSGFPKKIKGKQICPEAQVLHIVGILLKKISLSPGQISCKFQDAFDSFRNDYYSDPSKCAISPILLNEINELLQNKVKKMSSDSEVTAGKWKMS